MNLRVYVCVCENILVVMCVRICMCVYMCEDMYASVCRCACVCVCPRRPEAWDVLGAGGMTDDELRDGWGERNSAPPQEQHML